MRVSAKTMDYSGWVGALFQCIGVARECMLCPSLPRTMAWHCTTIAAYLLVQRSWLYYRTFVTTELVPVSLYNEESARILGVLDVDE